MDFNKELKIRKELYEKERKAEENWYKKWGFLKNLRKLWEDEATRLGYPLDIFGWNKINKKSIMEERVEKYTNFHVEKIPKLSSGMIGWVSSINDNNLDKLFGPLYVSRKQTKPDMDEPHLNDQKFIFLG